MWAVFPLYGLSLFEQLLPLLFKAARQQLNELSGDSRLSQLLTYLNKHYEATLDDACLELGMSRSSFNTFLHEVANTTFSMLLRELRINHACGLLRNDDLSVAEISYSCGFSTPSFFSATFRRVKGMLPKDYRAIQGDRDAAASEDSGIYLE